MALPPSPSTLPVTSHPSAVLCDLAEYDLSRVTLGYSLSWFNAIVGDPMLCYQSCFQLCLRGPHVVLVAAAFNLCKFLTEMGLQVVRVWRCRGARHLVSIITCRTAVTKHIKNKNNMTTSA